MVNAQVDTILDTNMNIIYKSIVNSRLYVFMVDMYAHCEYSGDNKNNNSIIKRNGAGYHLGPVHHHTLLIYWRGELNFLFFLIHEYWIKTFTNTLLIDVNKVISQITHNVTLTGNRHTHYPLTFLASLE